jgi:hypothetical protein
MNLGEHFKQAWGRPEGKAVGLKIPNRFRNFRLSVLFFNMPAALFWVTSLCAVLCSHVAMGQGGWGVGSLMIEPLLFFH